VDPKVGTHATVHTQFWNIPHSKSHRKEPVGDKNNLAIFAFGPDGTDDRLFLRCFLIGPNGLPIGYFTSD
jgi:hypothetical protein